MSATLNIYVKSEDGTPVEGAVVTVITKNASILPATRYTSGDGGCNLVDHGSGFEPPLEVDIVVVADGFKPWCSADEQFVLFGRNDINKEIRLTKSFKKPGRLGGCVPGVVPVKRAPLPPFDTDTTDPENGAHLHVNTRMWQQIPPRCTPHWWRGNAFGVTVPGLPYVTGGASGPAQTRALSWFLNRYPPKDQDRIIQANLDRNYDKFILSPEDSYASGQSIDDYVAMAAYVHQAGLVPAHMVFSKIHGRNPDPSRHDLLLEKLKEKGLLNVLSVGWELDLFMDPGSVITGQPSYIQKVIDHVWSRVYDAGPLMYVHFSPDKFSWQKDSPPPPDPRSLNGGDFWKPNVGKLTGNLYQCDPNWSVGMMQAKINDGLVRLKAGGAWGLPVDFDVVAYETIATKQYYDEADEDRGDLVGYEVLCSEGPMPVMGGCNGHRWPDGTAI